MKLYAHAKRGHFKRETGDLHQNYSLARIGETVLELSKADDPNPASLSRGSTPKLVALNSTKPVSAKCSLFRLFLTSSELLLPRCF